MKSVLRICLNLGLIFCILSLLTACCANDPDPPTVKTISITNITKISAETGGDVVSDGGSEVKARGVCWSITENPTIENDSTVNGTGVGEFSCMITNLEPNTTYFVRAYAVNGIGTAYGEELSFTTYDYQTVWQEGFELYSVQIFPNTWIKDANANDLSNNFVTDNTSTEGSKSLKLYGQIGGCWAAICYRSLSTSYPFFIEVDIKNGNEILSGCHPDRAVVALKKSTTWTNPVGRSLVQFYRDGFLYLAGEKTDQFTTNTWYTIKIKYEKISLAEMKFTYWINGTYKGNISYPVMDEEDQITYVELAVEEGTAWFDNVRIFK